MQELPMKKTLPLVRINEVVMSIINHHNLFFNKFNQNLFDSNLSNYTKTFSNPSQLLNDFLYELESTEKRIKTLIEIKYIEKGSMTKDEYNTKLKDIANSDDFIVKKISNRIILEANTESENVALKNEKYLQRLVANSNKKLNEIINNIISEIIKELEETIEIEEKEVYYEIELFTDLLLDKEAKSIINKHLENKNLLAINMLINLYYQKNIVSKNSEESLDMKRLNYLKQKILFIKMNRTKFLINKLKRIYDLSGLNDQKFQTMNYELSSIQTIRQVAYKPNYPLMGFLLGFFISIWLVNMRFSYLDFKQNKNI